MYCIIDKVYAGPTISLEWFIQGLFTLALLVGTTIISVALVDPTWWPAAEPRRFTTPTLRPVFLPPFATQSPNTPAPYRTWSYHRLFGDSSGVSKENFETHLNVIYGWICGPWSWGSASKKRIQTSLWVIVCLCIVDLIPNGSDGLEQPAAHA